MRRKSLIVLGVIIVLFTLQSCKSQPEQTLLKNYCRADSLNDIQTMSTMAINPMKLNAASWTITKVSEEKTEPAALSDMAKAEGDFKKQQDAHIPVTLDAKDALELAKDEFNSARTGPARAAAKTKVDAAQKKYDDEYKLHQEIIKKYSDAKVAAAKEEEITMFSLGAGQLPNIRDLKGDIRSKDIELQVKDKAGAVKNYLITMRVYTLKDEALNLTYRGRWIITQFKEL
ncbi:MAG: hypothetical protein ABSF88_03475 [Candidatus Aminicenantales bacterium]|jgi:hypothetical protein